MAGDLNKVMIIGRLGRDPETRYAQSGMAICKLSVAVSSRVKKGDGWKDETEWFRVTTFGKTAENAAKYLQKGRQVYVEGRFKTEKYKDKDGVERTSTEVVADEVKFLGDKSGGASRPPSEPRPPAAKPDDLGLDEPPASDGFVDDDLPFMRLEPLYW
jgi:single-strand DNA-binding protein